MGRLRRLAGFVRALRRVHARAGTAGTVELLASRALPRALSINRVTLIDAPAAPGGLAPHLSPRRVRASDPEVERLYADLMAGAEPEAGGWSPSALDRRFAAGHELWLFEVDGRVAHLRWIVRDALRFADLAVPLGPGECVHEGVVTLAGARRGGLNRAAGAHLRAVYSEAGVTRMLSAINGFNRQFARDTLGIAGARTAAVVTVALVAGRRFYRARADDGPGREVLARAGLVAGGGRPVPARARAASPAELEPKARD